MKLSIAKARRLALRGQGLGGRWELPAGTEGAAEVIERLGYIQIDTIAVVQRAHEHTFWARYPKYTPKMLHAMQAEDRRGFEYWTHAMSYVPMRDYRYYLPRMRTFTGGDRYQKWHQENKPLMKQVLE